MRQWFPPEESSLLRDHAAGLAAFGIALAHQDVERRNRLLQRVTPRPMKQVAIEPIGAQARQRLFAGGQSAVFRGIAGQHLGNQKNLVAPALDGLADDSLRRSRPVHFRGVDVRQAEIESASQRRDGAGGGRSLHFPCTLANAGDVSPGRAE